MQSNGTRLTIGGAAKYLGVSVDSIRRWEKKNLIKSLRSPGGHRYFLKSDLTAFEDRPYKRTQNPQPKVSSLQEQPAALKATEKVQPTTSPIIHKAKHHKVRVFGIAALIIFFLIDAILLFLFYSAKSASVIF